MLNRWRKALAADWPQRLTLVTMLLLGLTLLLATAYGSYFAVFQPTQLRQLFPGSIGVLYALQLITGGLGMLSLLGVLLLSRWGVRLYVLTSLLALACDWLTRAPKAHLISASISAAFLLALCFVNRKYFDPLKPP